MRKPVSHGWAGLVALVVPAVALAEIVTSGPEFQVSSFTTGLQSNPTACAGTGGAFVIAWRGAQQDGDQDGIFAQRFARDGTRRGTEFQVNTYTTDDQTNPLLCCDAAGDFVIVWDSRTQDSGTTGVFGRRYASTGTPLGAEFQVNAYTTGTQSHAALACHAAGDFVVVWESQGQLGIFGQRFTSGGVRAGTEFQVNGYATGGHTGPAIAADPRGGFVVAWSAYGQPDALDGALARRFTSDALPLGTEFLVNAYTTGGAGFARIAVDGAGGFAVIWDGLSRDGSGQGVFGQRFASTGAPLGTDFQVNAYTTGKQVPIAVAADAAGDLVVVWTSADEDGSGYGVFGQRFDASGARHGSEFQVNSYTTGDQGYYGGTVVGDVDGDFLVVWSSGGQDGSGQGVYAQRYQDPCGDAVLGAGEQCDLGDRRPGNCCSPTCQLVPADCAACMACDPAKGCVVGPRADCRHPVKRRQATLALTNSPSDAKDKVSFAWSKGAATAPGDLGDPRTAPDYTLCVFDRQGGADRLVLKATAPAGGTCGRKPCWRKAGRRGFAYRDREATPNGLTMLAVTGGGAGRARASVTGKGPGLELPALGLTAPVTGQLQVGGGAGACFAGTFAKPRRNTATQLSATGE